MKDNNELERQEGCENIDLDIQDNINFNYYLFALHLLEIDIDLNYGEEKNTENKGVSRLR